MMTRAMKIFATLGMALGVGCGVEPSSSEGTDQPTQTAIQSRGNEVSPEIEAGAADPASSRIGRFDHLRTGVADRQVARPTASSTIKEELGEVTSRTVKAQFSANIRDDIQAWETKARALDTAEKGRAQ